MNFVRSDWQVSRAFAEANLLEAVLFYSQKCLKNTLKFDFKVFDLFFAYETNIRVYKLLGNIEKVSDLSVLAKGSVKLIPKKSDRDYCLKELNKIIE